MPTFTVALKDAIEYVPEIVSDTLAHYPIFDEGYRDHLNQQILDQFWNQEIGQETIDLFNFALRRKLNQIMPIYNQQYIISRIKFDPLVTVNISNVGDVKALTSNTGNSTNAATTDSKSRTVAQQLPQTLLSANGDYATGAQDTTSETTVSGNGTETATGSQDQTTTASTTGYQGNPAMLLLQYRQSLVNVDMMILDELKELFMLIWSNGDEFSERNYSLGYFTSFPF